MLAAVRRYGVAQALRAPVSRSFVARPTPQLLKAQPSLRTTALPQLSRPFHVSSVLRSAQAAQVETVDPDTSSPDRLTEFADLAKHGLIDPKIINTITGGMKITTMTEVQSMTINETLRGDDVLAQARTGTGKTLAFLLPVVQNILKSLKEQPSGTGRRVTSRDIRGIIISPTRELAEQIAQEALKITRGTGVVVQAAVGGTQKREKLQAIRREGCHLLVGTPGRLKDILSDPMSGVEAPRLSSFVLDEADRLLDDGFAPEIEEISQLLPDRKDVDRQSLLFSATVPREVMSVVRHTMKPDFKFVKTVRDDEVPTHMRVPQKSVVLNGLENALPAVLELAKNYSAKWDQDRSQPPFKAIVYFNSTNEVAMAHQVFRTLREGWRFDRNSGPLGRMSVFELHSRLTQNRRTRMADLFRTVQSGILLSSDVSARGMDFPNVSHVIQVGVPQDKSSYIHRLGRTGRANKSGEGWIMVHKEEINRFRRQLGELPIEMDQGSLATTQVDMTQGIPEDDSAATAVLKEMSDAMTQVPDEMKDSAYMSQLGTLIKAFPTKDMMIEALNDLAIHGYGLPEPPYLAPALLSKIGMDSGRGSRGSRPQQNDRFRSGGMQNNRLRFHQDKREGFQRGGFQRDGRSNQGGNHWMGRGTRRSIRD